MSDKLTIKEMTDEILNKRAVLEYSDVISTIKDVAEEILDKRVLVNYNAEEIMDIEENKLITLTYIKQNERHKKCVIYESQDTCSLQIVANLNNRKILNVIILALTQSVKTGTMCALIKNYLKNKNIPIENFYIITGLSSVEWTEQTKERMPKTIQNRVYHRGQFKKFIKDIKGKKNVLVIIDEIQIAARENQSLFKAFQNSGFNDKQNLFKNDVKIVEFSATPNGTIYDRMKWGENSAKIMMPPGYGYKSCFDLSKEDRIKQFRDLTCWDKDKNVDKKKFNITFTEIQKTIDKFPEPKYNIIRTPTGQKGNIVIDNFKEKFPDEFKFVKYDQDSDLQNINEVLKIKPEVTHFIFIKEKLRCAKTLFKSHLGFIYERYTVTPDDSVIIQGGLGRLTGYDDPGETICFTNIPSIKKYKKLWDSDFEPEDPINWKSNSTIFKEKKLESKGTYAKSQDNVDDDKSKNTEDSIYIKQCKTQPEARDYYNQVLHPQIGGGKNEKRCGPKKKKANQDGFFETTVARKRRVYSYDEIYNIRKWALNKTSHKYTFHPCYLDVNDKETLRFCFCHYKF
jgi:hypothetical protein